MRVSTIFKLFLLLCLVNFILTKPLKKKGRKKVKKNKQQKEAVEPIVPTTTAPSVNVDLPNEAMRGGLRRPVGGAPEMPREDEDDDDGGDSMEPTQGMTPHQQMMKARSYMGKYGYMQMMDSDSADGIASEEMEKEVVKMMQMFMGLKPTGRLTRKTMEMLDRPRCGVHDPVMSNETVSGIRSRRYVHNNLRWDENELKFRILSYPAEMTREEVRASIYRAFQVWSDVAPIRFYEVQSGYAHFYLSFGTYSHGDPYPFDGPGGILAHAFLPKVGWGDLEGDVHFDDSEYFTFRGGGYNTFNLFQVAAHEIGHALGLEHSLDRSALMAPFYPGYIENFQLPYDDILGITSLYGSGYGGPVGPHPSEPDYNPVEPAIPEDPPTTTRPTTTRTTTTERTDSGPDDGLPPPDDCNQVFDATGYFRGEVFIFKGDKYWRMRNNTLISSPDGDRASAFFQDFPGDIDGAYESYQQNRFYVFKGSNYYVYKDLTLESGPTPIRELDPNLPNNIDSVLSWQEYGKTYFFKDDLVWRFDERTRQVDSTEWPADISVVWKGVPHGLTASFHDEIISYTYFLKGSNYYRYDDYRGEVDQGYPRPFGWDFLRCY